jgi:hypothetical protein
MENPATEPTDADRSDIADLLIESTRFRMQCRVDACLERHGNNVADAVVSRGIGISYLFAQDIVRALESAAAEIGRLRGVASEFQPERVVPTVIGRVTGNAHEGDQCRGMPRAICHACGLGYRCWNPDCEQTGQAPSLANGPRSADQEVGVNRRDDALERLRLVAADIGPFHGHSPIASHEAVEIQAEIENIRLEISELSRQIVSRDTWVCLGKLVKNDHNHHPNAGTDHD